MIKPKKSARRQTLRVDLRLVIFSPDKYTFKTYKVVSVEPIIILAVSPIKESGVYTLNISQRIALAPEPEIGLNIIKGSNSLLKWNILQIGDRIDIKKSLNPLSLKTLTLIMNVKRNGKMLKVVFSPFFAPVTNVA